MIDAEFVDKVIEVVKEPQVIRVGDRERLVLPPHWTAPDQAPPKVLPLLVGTLTGLVDYMEESMPQTMDEGASDGELAPVLIHIQDPETVCVLGALEEEDKDFRRQVYLKAETKMVGQNAIQWGAWTEADFFTIGLKACFLDTPERRELEALIASIKDKQVVEVADSGSSQRVTATRGVVLGENVSVKNPWLLQPYRTFREVEQPASEFLIRFQGSPQGEAGRPKIALFDAAGNMWKLEAITRIKAWLREKLGDGARIIG